MPTRHPSQFRRLCGVGLCVVLVAGINTPIASGETPEERCKRETEAYNRAWKDAWIRNHPREVAKGEQPPAPTPPYRCFGHDTPQQDMPGYTPPPGATIPPAGSAPGSGAPADTTPNSGGGAGEGSSPGFLPESPNPLDDPASSESYPYGYHYPDSWADRKKHPTPPSSPATGNSPATAHGNGPTATGNGLTGRGNGVNPKGTPPHSTPPAHNDTNPVKRWWHNLTHHQPQRVERMEAESDTRPPASGERGEKARGAQEFVSCTLVRQTEVIPGRRMGYPGGSFPDPRFAGTDLGYQLRIGGKRYALFGDSFDPPGKPESSHWSGWWLVPVDQAGYPSPNGSLIDGKTLFSHTRYPSGRRLPAGVIHTLDGNDIVMITPLHKSPPIGKNDSAAERKQKIELGMKPRGNGELYRLTTDKRGRVVAHKIGETPDTDMTQMSGFQRREHGKTVTYITTNNFERTKGIVLWRVTDPTQLGNVNAWEWYNPYTTHWVRYHKGQQPEILPGSEQAMEMDFRQLPDGSVVLLYGQGKNMGLRMRAVPTLPTDTLSTWPAVEQFYTSPQIQQLIPNTDGRLLATALCWAPAFGITPPGAVATYAPQVTNPDTATLFNLAMSFSSWPHHPNGSSSAYNTSYATIGPLIYPNLSPTCLPSPNK